MTGTTRPHPYPCKCRRCRDATSAYERLRYRERGYGRWAPFTDAAPVRRHLLALQDAGVGATRAADLAGVSRGAVNRVLYTSGTRPPAKRIRAETAAALLAVGVTEPNLSGKAHTDATGTRRRLQALAANGWPLSAVAAEAGLTPEHTRRIVRGFPQVTANTARKVRAAYDRLAYQPPPQRDRWERMAASRTRAMAARNGWAVPAAWDEHTIDDPKGRPCGVRRQAA